MGRLLNGRDDDRQPRCEGVKGAYRMESKTDAERRCDAMGCDGKWTLENWRRKRRDRPTRLALVRPTLCLLLCLFLAFLLLCANAGTQSTLSLSQPNSPPLHRKVAHRHRAPTHTSAISRKRDPRLLSLHPLLLVIPPASRDARHTRCRQALQP